MSERFLVLFRELRSDPDAVAAAKKAALVLQFRFFAPASYVVLDMTKEPFDVGAEEHPQPEVEIGLTPEAADRVLSGRLSAVEAVKTSVVRVRGGFMKFLALQGFLEVVRAAYKTRYGAPTPEA